jgi:preprotein translocase subunit Sec61beta
MKPILDPQVVAVVAILFGLFVVLIEGGSRLTIASRP